jgi:type II secretory pathway pseudopilin PulG
MSTRQTRSHKAEKKAAAQASTFIENALEEVKRKRRSKSEGWPCTAEQITAERDTKGLSWKQVAVNLGLPNPGAARSAYTELTGRPHSDAAPVRQRAARSTTSVNGVRHKRNLVEWNDDTDQDEMIEALTHHWRRPHLPCRRYQGGDRVDTDAEFELVGHVCEVCGGTGKWIFGNTESDKQLANQTPCPTCDGKAWVRECSGE